MAQSLLSAAFWLAASVYLWAATADRRPLVYLLKPGSMALVVALAAGGVANSPVPGPAWAVVAGLACSLVGDVMLMLPRERFVAGLVSFLLGHLCYAGAIWTVAPGTPGGVALVVAGVLLALGVTIYRRLAAGMMRLGQARLRGPVILYITVLSLLVWRAVLTLFQVDPVALRPTVLVAAALLFYLSDALLAWDRFVHPLPWRHLWVMGSYFAAQYGFAAAVIWPEG